MRSARSSSQTCGEIRHGMPGQVGIVKFARMTKVAELTKSNCWGVLSTETAGVSRSVVQ